MIADPALVLVDLQKDFCKPGHTFKDRDPERFEKRQPALQAAGAFLDRYRESGRTPILLRTHHDPLTDSGAREKKYERQDIPTPCVPGSEGAEFVPELDVQESDVVVTKHRYDGFVDTNLDVYLRANDIETVLLGGVGTGVCVEATMFGALNRDYDVVLLEDCANDKEHIHEATCDKVEERLGVVKQSTDVTLEPVESAVEAD